MRDPRLPSLALVALFVLLALPRFAVPGFYLFDEAFYVPAALSLLDGEAVLNREHPMLGKEILALSIALFGDNPLGWRAPGMVMMPAAIFLAMRAMWHFTRDAAASLLLGALLATSCLTLVLARVGTLDAPMLFFAAAGVWALSKGRANAAAVLFGLSLACKWTIAPLLPVLAAMVAWTGGEGWRGWLREFARFGLIPLAFYAVTFAPGFFVRENPLSLADLLPLHLAMKDALLAYDGPSPYPGRWWEVPLGLAPHWALAGEVQGAWRFVMVTINPVTVAITLGGVLASWRDRRALLLLPFWLVPLVLAALSDRLNFTHQYALSLAVAAAMAALLMARLSRLWIGGIVVAACAAMAFFHPYLTAAPFASQEDGMRAVWIDRWQFKDILAWTRANRVDWEGKRALQQTCLERPRECRIADLKGELPALMARHRLTAVSILSGQESEPPIRRTINAAPERLASSDDVFRVTAQRGSFRAVALFEGDPPDRRAATAAIRAYLLSLDRARAVSTVRP